MPRNHSVAISAALLLLVAGGLIGAEPSLFRDAARESVLCPSPVPFTPFNLLSREILVDLDVMGSRGEAGRVDIELLGGDSITAVRDRIEWRGDGDYSWFGHIDGSTHDTVTLVVQDGGMAGSVHKGGRLFRVSEACEGVHLLAEIDTAALASAESAQGDDAVPVDVPGDAFSPDPPLGTSTIDVLVVYTAAAAASAQNIRALIQLAVDEANTAYANSLINQRIRLVGSYQVSYTQSGVLSTDLDCLTYSGGLFSPMDEVHVLRNSLGADLVTLWVHYSSLTCGYAWLMSTVSSGFDKYGFSIVELDCVAGFHSLAHELGHNMGARHDWAVDSETTPYAYAHGFAYPAGLWRTVMAYNTACAPNNCTRLPYFSNPNVRYGGVAMGVAEGNPHPADNTRTLNNTAATVAAFRSSQGACPYAVQPASRSHSGAGGTGTISVVCPAGCRWTATSNAPPWIKVTSSASGSGSSRVEYTVAANSGAARTGTIRVAGQDFVVTQEAGGCPDCPTITRINSAAGKPGSSATIIGTGFSTIKSQNTVYFGAKKVKTLNQATKTSIRLTIPPIKKGIVQVRVVVKGKESNRVSFLVK